MAKIRPCDFGIYAKCGVAQNFVLLRVVAIPVASIIGAQHLFVDFSLTEPDFVRFNAYMKPRYNAHPKDCSVMTYRGHAVLRTLIRCHFSPAETTGGQYLYSGSADGRIHVCTVVVHHEFHFSDDLSVDLVP